MLFEKKIVEIYKRMAFTRCDDTGIAHYFSADDFDGLSCKSYPFRSSIGHKLQGYIYEYENAKEDRLIVFDHGFGGGHRSYLREIEKLCSHGFRVFAYDHTGCMQSEGDTPNGMSQSLRDLDDCIKTLRADENFQNADISVVGHSWGGFSTLNISALHPEISHIVAMSGFVSVEMLISSIFCGIAKPYRKPVMAIERDANPDFVDFNAVQSLKKSSAKALLIYSDNDAVVKQSLHYDALKNGLAGRENTVFLLEHNKGHNPNYTEKAVALLSDFGKRSNKFKKTKDAKSEKSKKKFRDSFDWWAITEQDDAVWNKIFEFLDT